MPEGPSGNVSQGGNAQLLLLHNPVTEGKPQADPEQGTSAAPDGRLGRRVIVPWGIAGTSEGLWMALRFWGRKLVTNASQLAALAEVGGLGAAL